MLLSEIQAERTRLEQDAVDLLIDSRRCLVQTRESGSIALGKQYVLLQILEALSHAHGRPGEDDERGLSKAEIIQRVWKESYRPEAHDNKLYYNINRLRKLIEPDVRKPQYLLNWKEGYRLAPGLKVHLVGQSSTFKEEKS
jgi:DNA-binding winged helix-turn-helix (wHTH) protein